MTHQHRTFRDLPGSPVVKTSPSRAGGVGRELGSHIPCGQKVKTLKNTHTHKKKQKQYCNKSNKEFQKERKGHSITVIQMKIYSQRQVKSLKIGARELVELSMVAAVAWVLSQLVRLLT